MINNLKLIDGLDLDEFIKNIKDARESKNVTIEQASKTLHIEKNIIEKLEDGNFEKISIDVFIIGHIRSYLNWIGIDPKLLINNDKTKNINLKKNNNKISLPFSFKISEFYISKISEFYKSKISEFYKSKISLFSFKISKFYISIIALALFIIILIIFNNINTLEEKDTPNKNIANYEILITKEKNNNQTEEISKEKFYSNEPDNYEENNIESEEISQNLKEENQVVLEEISQNLKEENKIEYENITESKIVKGDTILGLLKNVKWSIKEAMEAANIFSTLYDPKRINVGMTIIFPKNRNIKSFAIAINKNTAVVIKMENKNFKVDKQSLEKAREIISSSKDD